MWVRRLYNNTYHCQRVLRGGHTFEGRPQWVLGAWKGAAMRTSGLANGFEFAAMVLSVPATFC